MWFHKLMDEVFQPQHASSSPPKQQEPPSVKGTLLCGLDAINHIMAKRDRLPVHHDVLDEITSHVASLEAQVRGDGTPLDTAPSKEGNYHVTVLTLAIQLLADLHVSVWKHTSAHQNQPFCYLLGNGHHWQTMVREGDDWFVRDKKSFRVENPMNFLAQRILNALVLE